MAGAPVTSGCGVLPLSCGEGRVGVRGGQLGVDVGAGQRAGRGGGADLGGGSVALPATHTPGTSVVPAMPEAKRRPMPLGRSCIGSSEALQALGARQHRGRDREDAAGHDLPVGQPHAGDAAVVAVDDLGRPGCR